MQRQVLIAAGGGLASALLSLGLLAGGGSFALLAYFAPLPLFAAGLMMGLRTSVIAGAFAVVVLFVLGGIASAGLYALSIMIPTWIVVYHALSHRFFTGGGTGWYTPGDIVSRLAALGAAVVAVAILAQMGNDGGVEASVRALLVSAITPLVPGAEVDQMSSLVDRVAPLFPSFATLSWLLMMLVNAALAQALLTKWGKAMRATPDYAQIELPEWTSWLLVVAAALKILSSGDLEYLAQNLVVVLAAPFFFVGLAVVHTLVRRTRFPGAGLAVFYTCLMLFSWFAVLVAAVGFAEQWARLRDRFGPLSGPLAPRPQPDDE
jgi:hypothetical protein